MPVETLLGEVEHRTAKKEVISLLSFFFNVLFLNLAEKENQTIIALSVKRMLHHQFLCLL